MSTFDTETYHRLNRIQQQTQRGPSPQPRTAELSEMDVDRIARRVAEILKGEA